MPLSQVTQQINDVVQAARAEAPEPTVETMRDGWASLIEMVGTTATTCAVAPVSVGGLDSLLFTPPERDDGLLVWFHGGGWVVGSPSTAVNEVDRLAVAARCTVVSVGYRLAPEHPFPAPQHDGIAAARWCIEHAASLGASPTAVAVGGDSAGGNLAAVAALSVPGLCAQVLVYPACDATPEGRAGDVHTEGYLLDAASMAFFFSCAVGDADVTDPVISPMRAPREVLALSPPAYIVTAEYDPISIDGQRYAALLRDAGVHVETAHFHEEMHGFFSMPELIDDARIAIAGASGFLTARFARE